MKIYIMRHGQTAWNAERRIQGRSDIDLNENGVRLAGRTGEALAEVPFSVAFTSPLVRARHTAELILGERDIPLIVDERLVEISFGVYEGRCFKGEKKDVPDGWFQNFMYAPQDYQAAPGGETLDEVEARTADFMRDLCGRKELADATVFVSTHGCALRGLLNSLRDNTREDYWHGGVSPNCSVSIVTCAWGQRPVLVEENHIYYE